KQRRIFQEGTSDRDTLALPARELHAAITKNGCEALRQRLDEFTAARETGSFDDLGIRRVGPAVPDVFHGRAMEHRKILRDDSDGGAQALLCDSRNVLPIY